MLELRLQFFGKDGPGGEKTEEPTQKKLEDARKEGQVSKSKEIGNAVSLIALFLMLKLLIPYLGNGFTSSFEDTYGKIPQIITYFAADTRTGDLEWVLKSMMLQIVLLLLPFLAGGFLVAFLADYIQVKWKITFKPMQPKLNKISPLSGLKRMFSLNSIMEFVKSILKIGLIVWVVYTTLRDQYNVIYLLFNMELWHALGIIGEIVIGMGLRCSVAYILVALIDFIYQKRKFRKDQMMTKQEIKDEYKQSEGNPEIKGKIRQKMQEASRRRMMQSLPEADVVITNPTHYAVAIKYDNQSTQAPLVLAKGENYLAQRIKEIAKENKVEIVENKPLARMLYHNVEVGEEIPPELYQAVAEVLAMVYHAQGKI